MDNQPTLLSLFPALNYSLKQNNNLNLVIKYKLYLILSTILFCFYLTSYTLFAIQSTWPLAKITFFLERHHHANSFVLFHLRIPSHSLSIIAWRRERKVETPVTTVHQVAHID